MKKLLGIVSLIGLFILGITNIASIGYFLYLWGVTGLACGVAAWITFKLWISLLITGLILVLVGIWK